MKLRHLSAAALAAALVLAGCSGDAGSPGGPGDNATDSGSGGGSSRTDANVAVTGEISTLDPTGLSTAFTSGGDRASSIYGALMKYDADGSVIPAMAESLESDDLTTWTLSLREGVKFTDGEPYDAEAVVFNINRHIAEDSTSAAKTLLAKMTSMEIIDPLTVEFTLSEPSGSFPSLLTNNTTLGYIGSPKAIEADEEGFATNPVGAGPFVIQDWVRDSHMDLVKSDTYWDADNVKLEKLRFTTIADNQTRTQAMKSKQLDMIPPAIGSEWVQFLDSGDFKLYLDGSTGAQAFYPNVTRGPFANLEIRRAVQMGIDPAAANTILNSDALEWDGNHDCIPFALDSETCVSGIYPEANVEEAKKIIAEYIAEGGDNKVKLHSSTNQYLIHDYVVQVLTELGFDVTLSAVDLSQYAAGTLEGEYDAMVAIRLPFVNPFPAFFNMISQGGSNYPKQNDAEFQEALEAARDAAPEDQAKAWAEVNRQIQEKAYAFWMAPSSNRTVTVQEFHPGNDFTVSGGGVWYPADAYFE